MGKNKYHTVGTIPKSNMKIIERGKIDTSCTQIHDRILKLTRACIIIVCFFSTLNKMFVKHKLNPKQLSAGCKL